MIGSYKAVQQENFQLREYIIQLQARLLEAHSDVPPPPAHIDLTNPPQRPEETPTAQMTSNAVEELRLAAAAAEQAAGITTAGSHPPRSSSSTEGEQSRSPWVASMPKDS